MFYQKRYKRPSLPGHPHWSAMLDPYTRKLLSQYTMQHHQGHHPHALPQQPPFLPPHPLPPIGHPGGPDLLPFPPHQPPPLPPTHQVQNKCSVGPETSITEIEKGQGPTSFSERGLSYSEIGHLSDLAMLGLTVQIKEKKSPLEEKEEAESFSIEDIRVLCHTDTFFLPFKRHEPRQKSMK